MAIERIHVKQADQVEIRFSSWDGDRLLPRPLDLPEAELLPLIEAAIREGVFSETFTDGLRRLVAGPGPAAEAAAEPATELERVREHFHTLIRSRAGAGLGDQASSLPELSANTGSEEEPAWFAVAGMDGGFKYWWDTSAAGLRLISESWSQRTPGSGQLHEITADGARLLGEGFV